jgi:hypothetical protein
MFGPVSLIVKRRKRTLQGERQVDQACIVYQLSGIFTQTNGLMALLLKCLNKLCTYMCKISCLPFVSVLRVLYLLL